MDRIGIAILGSGAIAKVHADCFKALGDICEVRAVCDIFPDKAEALIKEKELDAAALSDYSQLWDMEPRSSGLRRWMCTMLAPAL